MDCFDRRRALGVLGSLGISGLVGCRPSSKSRSQSESEASELIVVNGILADHEKSFASDIRIKDGKIAELGTGLAKNNQVIPTFDAKQRVITPSGVDPHVHLSPPWVDDYDSGSKAALAGGITTLGHMLNLKRGQTWASLLDDERQRIANRSLTDVFLHPVLQPGISHLDDLKRFKDFGQTSVKFFMVTRSFAESISAAEDLIRQAGKLGILTLIHAEDKSIIDSAIEKLKSTGKTSLKHYAESRPISAEFQATRKAIEICRRTEAPIYLVHVSSAAALEECRRAKAAGLPVFVETRPMYLHFTEKEYQSTNGSLYIGMPPLRTENDVKALWQGLADGTIDTIATDHAPWTRDQKLDPKQTIETPNGGVNNLQYMLPMLMHEGVQKKRITLQQFVKLTSFHSSKLFGLGDQKNCFQIGSDADLVVWNSDSPRKIDGQAFGYSRAGYSIYDGMETSEWPALTIRRGEIVFRDEAIVGASNKGTLVKRTSFSPTSIGH